MTLSKYFYHVKLPEKRKNIDLLDFIKFIRDALRSLEGTISQSIKVHEKYFTFKTTFVWAKEDKQAMGKKISKICPGLREFVTEYRIKVGKKTIISRQLFIHMTKAAIKKIKKGAG